MQIKNIAKGPRGVNTKNGHRWIEPGETADVDMADEEVAVSEKTGWFEISGKAPKNPETPPVDREELKAQADKLNIEYAPNITTPKLKELVDAKVAEQQAQ